MSEYTCSLCGKKNVKLWRPCADDNLLVCACCAEARQSPMKYDEYIWEKTTHGYRGKPTGRKRKLPRWRVDNDGSVPSYNGPGPKALGRVMCSTLIVNLKDISEAYPSGETSMLPATFDEDGDLLDYHRAREQHINSWKALPTR